MDEKLIIGIGGQVCAVNPGDGAIAWAVKLSTDDYVTFDMDAELIVASTADNRVVGIDRHTGAERFNVAAGGYGKATILMTTKCVYVAKGGYLDCIAHDGAVIWRQELKGLGFHSATLGLGDRIVLADKSR